MSYRIEFSSAVREKLCKGVETLSDAVKVTYGPNGRNVIIESIYGNLKSTKDGVTVAKSVNISDTIESIGAEMVKEASIGTNKLVGDGTTTSTILASTIFKLGLDKCKSNVNVIEVKKGIELAVREVVDNLYSHRLLYNLANNREGLLNIATISANGDDEIGKDILEAFTSAGIEGIITIESSTNTKTEINIVRGMHFDRGYLSPYFTNIQEKKECVLEDVYIFLYNTHIYNIDSILPILEHTIETNKSLLIITESIENEVLQVLINNKVKGKLKVAVIKAPGFGISMQEQLEDISLMTKATIYGEQKGITIKDFSIGGLGTAIKVVLTGTSSIIYTGKEYSEDVKIRANKLKSAITSEDIIDNIVLKKRVSNLIGGIATIQVGANSENEVKERLDRYEDSYCAVKAALEEGIIVGGGIAYLKSISILDKLKKRQSNKNIILGIEIMQESLESPFNQLLYNAGLEPNIYKPRLLKQGLKDFSLGFNVRTERYEDFIETSIIDPVKVVRVALETAASVSGLLLTTECVIGLDKQ